MGYKLGPWHGADMPPVREGVYETDEDILGRCFSYWNGERFMYRCWELINGSINKTINAAYNNSENETSLPAITSWRGTLK